MVRINFATQALLRAVVSFFKSPALKTACAKTRGSYHSWASPDCVLPDASGKFFAPV